MSGEQSTLALPDIESLKIMLENAESTYEEETDSYGGQVIELENGTRFVFDSEGKLEKVE